MWFLLQSQSHHRMTSSLLSTTTLICMILCYTWGWSLRFKGNKSSSARPEAQISALGKGLRRCKICTQSHDCSLLSPLVNWVIWKSSHIAVNQGHSDYDPTTGCLSIDGVKVSDCRAGQSLKASLLRSFAHGPDFHLSKACSANLWKEC